MTYSLERFGSGVSAEHARLAAANAWAFVDVDREGFTPDAEALKLLTPAAARRLTVLPFKLSGSDLSVAVTDPDSEENRGLREALYGYTVRMHYANPETLDRLVAEHYSASGEARSLVETRAAAVPEMPANGDLGRVPTRTSSTATQLVTLMLETAIRWLASDIHLERTRDWLIVRLRVDGELEEMDRYQVSQAESVMQKIRVAAKLDDNERLPDSGVMHWEEGLTQPVSVRVEYTPSIWGGAVVMRVQTNLWRDLSSLGLSEHNEHRYRQAIVQPDGIVFSSGPTGSGKSTVSYASLKAVASPQRKIISLEGPVEFPVEEGVTQIEIDEEAGLTFEAGSRSLVRQDPNIIFIGEVRDTPTAYAAIDAAMTGHLVLSTIHTNSALDIPDRLARMGVEPSLLASTLLAGVGQRLVRKLCPECRIEFPATADAILAEGFHPEDPDLPRVLYRANPNGCKACRHGYNGRLPIQEVLLVTEDIAEALADRAPITVVRKLALSSGMRTMREDGWARIKAGITSMEAINGAVRRPFG